MGILKSIFGARHEDDSPELAAAIAWAVDRVDPLLKQIGGYPDRYRKPVARALEYAGRLAAKVPGPVPITPESYAANPVVHAMFPAQDHLHDAIDHSRAMQAFFREHPDTTELYALICMRRKVKSMFGMELEGEILRRDVPQEVVYFTDCTVAEPGVTEAEARRHIAQGFFESLVVHVANRIAARKLEKLDLERERDELLARLRSTGLEQRGGLESRLPPLLQRQQEVAASLELDRYSEDFNEVLLSPEKHLFLERTEMNLDSMGIIRKQASSGSDEVVFCDLIGRDRRRWTVTMMYCNHVENRATIASRLENAQRWLGL